MIRPIGANSRLVASYSAFCRNYGDHCTGTIGCRNWNEEAIGRMVRDLAAPWQSLRSTIQNRHGLTTVSVDGVMDWAIEYIGN